MPENLLVLFDIDGTLLLDDAYVHGRAMVQAMRSVYGLALPDDAVRRASPWGKTDMRIAREILSAAGLEEAAIDAGRTRWIAEAGRIFALEAPAARARWRVRPGMADGMTALAAAGMRLTVLTGNLRSIAATKLELIGLADTLAGEIGTYGDDAEERTELVPIARARAGGAGTHPWPRERTVVVGDTPGDIATGRADGVRTIVFASERFPPSALAGAEAVLERVDELVTLLSG